MELSKTIKWQEFCISSDLTDFPLKGEPAYLMDGIGGVCLAGSAVLDVFDTRCRIVPEMVVTLIPWQLASIKEISDDFRFTFFRLSHEMFTDTASSLFRFTPQFFSYMRHHFISEPVEGNIRRFLNFCDLLKFRVGHIPEEYRRESIMQLLRVLYWDVYVLYRCNPNASKAVKYTRKEELAFRFMRLITEDHALDKDVAYYAEKLGVSPKYLTTLVRKISGQSARNWIVYYTILEIKALLREPGADMKSITLRTNFPDQSTLSRFFRRYTSMTPSEYRKSIHF